MSDNIYKVLTKSGYKDEAAKEVVDYFVNIDS